MVDVSERLEVLLFRETTFYATSDYLTRMQLESQISKVESRASVSPKTGDSIDEAAQNHSSKKRKSLLRTSSNDEDNISTSPDSPNSAKRHNSGSTHSGRATNSTESSSEQRINKRWREKICDWAFKVVDHFNLRREIVSIMMNLLDRYLCAYPATVDKELFQLLSMTCLYLAIKLNEYHHLLLPDCKSSMESIIQLSRGSFTIEDMKKMEHDVLQRLQWRVHPPTPQLFLQHYLHFLPLEAQQRVQGIVQFMAELSTMDYFFVPYKPSEVALAAMINATEEVSGSSYKSSFLPFLGYFPQTANVQACRERLTLIYSQSHNRNDASLQSPSSNENASRASSPLSVMDAPQPGVSQGCRG